MRHHRPKSILEFHIFVANSNSIGADKFRVYQNAKLSDSLFQTRTLPLPDLPLCVSDK